MRLTPEEARKKSEEARVKIAEKKTETERQEKIQNRILFDKFDFDMRQAMERQIALGQNYARISVTCPPDTEVANKLCEAYKGFHPEIAYNWYDSGYDFFIKW